jgi:DNA-binding Lrp family transcriptional regulator
LKNHKKKGWSFVPDSQAAAPSAPVPNRVRLDDTDRLLLRELMADARIPNNVLAAKAGIAPSTCLGRVRALREAGVIKGFHASVDLEALGLLVYALISVRVNLQARNKMLAIGQRLRSLPNVQSVFLLAGDQDFLMHVACGTPKELRDFIAVHLASDPAIANTQTNLVFDHLTPGD